MTSDQGKWVGVVIGALLIVLCLGAVLIKPVIDAQLFWVIRVVLALAAGLVTSGLAGFLTLERKAFGFSIRAGGPMAVVVLVLLLDPAEVVGGAAQPEERKTLLREIELLADKVDLVKVNELTKRITHVKPHQVRLSARTEDLEKLKTALMDARRGGRPRLPAGEIRRPPG